MNKSSAYDVIIIGAGISGLVCGCYLAKKGFRTLILEKENKVGGYCSSFKRNSYQFDSTAHGVGAMRRGGTLNKIYNELNLEEYVNICRINPSDIVSTPDYRVNFYNSIEQTKSELVELFPKQKENLINFFNLLEQNNTLSLYVKLRNKTMNQVLDEYIDDYRLKAILSIPMLTMWVPTKSSAAIASIVSFKEFILDGGYYPEGGMQKFSNALLKRYLSYGGKVNLLEEVIKITSIGNMVNGVITEKNTQFKSKFIISSSDVKSTYFGLVGKEKLTKEIIKNLSMLEPCDSALIVYLVIDGDLKLELGKCNAFWYSQTYNINENCFRITEDNSAKCCFISFPLSSHGNEKKANRTVLLITIGAEYKNKNYWSKNKEILSDKLLTISENVIPSLKKRIIMKEIATPLTLERYTHNYKGSVHGWKSTVGQCDDSLIRYESPLKNLFISGHWVTQKIGQGGIAMAAYTAYQTVRIITSKMIDNREEAVIC